MQQEQSGQQTGTRNETYNIISVLYHSLQGAETIQTYLKDAKEGEIRSFLEEALEQNRELADRAKQLLAQTLQNEGGQSGSAFGFGQSGQSSGQSGQSGPGGQSGQGGQSSDQFGSSQGSSPNQNEPSVSGQSGGGIGGSSSGGGGGSF